MSPVQLFVDGDHDGMFETDLTAYMIEAQWRIGFEDVNAHLASPNEATFTLLDRDRALLSQPSPLQVGYPLRVQTPDARCLFQGLIVTLIPATGDHAESWIHVQAHSADHQWRAVSAHLPLLIQTNIREALSILPMPVD